MNFDDTPDEAGFRATVRDWISANAPHHLDEDLKKSGIGGLRLPGHDIMTESRAWQKKKADAGWAVPHWPKDYGGRGATPIERVVWQQEEGVYNQLAQPFAIGQGMCGPTVMAYASEDLKRQYLPKLASGEEIWCQLFSEPAGGSDVAALRTRAEKATDGSDEWVINGQKIWTSGAQYSDYGILLTRTDPAVPKHAGLTMFIVNMKAPGVDVRPIHQMSGGSEFNEVFFENVRISDSHRLGAVNDGWNVALTTLMNERMSIGSRLATGLPEIFAFVADFQTADGPAIDNASVRSKLADWAVKSSGLRYTAFRSISSLSKGERPGPENSIGKLVAGVMTQDIAKYAMELQGEAGILTAPDQAPAAALFQNLVLRTPGMRIAGGTDEILRNIIAERVLGLPGDIRVDKSQPFNQAAGR